jgi:hypothetical protein
MQQFRCSDSADRNLNNKNFLLHSCLQLLSYLLTAGLKTMLLMAAQEKIPARNVTDEHAQDYRGD